MSTSIAEIGSGIGTFLGDSLNPVLGKNEVTTTTTAPPASASSNTTMIVVVVVIVVVIVAGFLYFKNKKST